MKTVLLLRHAKSSWDQPSLSDFHRPLAPRGRKAAPLVGRHMAQSELVPSRVLCSAARRARETWELVAEALGEEIPVEFREDLYHASPGSVLSLLHRLADDVDSVLLVGHNPTFEELADLLTGAAEEEARANMSRKFPTGALAIVDFPVRRWKEVLAEGGYLRGFVRPKDLQ
ncbi:histidine phosphatase family protein [Gemmatimonadota bacterium]